MHVYLVYSSKKSEKYPRYTLTIEWVSESWYVHETQYYTAAQVNMLQLHALSRLSLKA